MRCRRIFNGVGFNYGKDQVYLAQLYADSPVESELKSKRIGNALSEAEQYFLQALQHGAKHASTYWELGELSFTYAINLPHPAHVDVEKDVQRYQQAADRYTQPEIDAGWRAEAYLRMGKAYLYSARQSPESLHLYNEVKNMLLKASADFARLKDQSGARSRDDIEEVRQLLSELEQGLKR